MMCSGLIVIVVALFGCIQAVPDPGQYEATDYAPDWTLDHKKHQHGNSRRPILASFFPVIG